jgi:hypothetical protein
MDPSTQFIAVSILKSLVEVAGLFLLGQGLLYVIAGQSRENNFVYKLFQIVTRPVFRLARWITPKVVIDRHMWIVGTLLLVWLWMIFTWLKVQLFLQLKA